jgi:uncharacterized damage-inducible protein DinB
MPLRRIPDVGPDPKAAWRTTNRVTTELVRALPLPVWNLEVPGVPRRTVREILVHLHNARCRWIKTLGREHGITAPVRVDQRRATQRQLAIALKQSSMGIEALLDLGLASGGEIPPSKGYVWRNLPLDVWHVLAYFVAHEAHHRGQIVLVARQAGLRLPPAVVNGLWWWKEPARGTRPRTARGK